MRRLQQRIEDWYLSLSRTGQLLTITMFILIIVAIVRSF